MIKKFSNKNLLLAILIKILLIAHSNIYSATSFKYKDDSEVIYTSIYKADSEGIYLRETEGRPAKLIPWKELDTASLEKGDKITKQVYEQSLKGAEIFFDKDGNPMVGGRNLFGITVSSDKVKKFRLTGINNTTVLVDGITKADTQNLYVLPQVTYEPVAVNWAYINKFALKSDEPKLYQVYLQLKEAKEKGEEKTIDINAVPKNSTTSPNKRSFIFRKSTGYEELKGAQLVSDPTNDGDSFHVKHKGKEYVFRLYYVDTAETSNEYPKRVKAQADYFGISVKDTLKNGHDATKFTRRQLSGSITVYTKWEDAMGQQKRYYAFILNKNGYLLSELLAEHGYVRIHGSSPPTPHGRSSSSWKSHLERLERRAKKEKLGAWGMK